MTYHGYNYDIVAIGNQCWFAENLQTQTYTNGEESSTLSLLKSG